MRAALLLPLVASIGIGAGCSSADDAASKDDIDVETAAGWGDDVDWYAPDALPSAATPVDDPSKPFRSAVREVLGTDLVRLENGMLVRLQGISIPDPAVRPPGFVERLRNAWILMLAPGYAKQSWFFPDPALEARDEADVVCVVRPDRIGPSYNERVLSEGLAVFNARTPQVKELDALSEAGRRAQANGVGWWSEVPERGPAVLPYLNGAVLGLHSDRGRYKQRLDELAENGFRHVCLTWSSFLDSVDAVRIDRHHPRGCPDDVLIETIEHARSLRMSVLLLPIVLIEHPGDDDWRGVLKPRDESVFWSVYDRFLAHYLDIAEVHGVDAFSIGSEFSSLEDREMTWRRIVRNARGRFRGLLTYSANWDHVVHARWFDALDFVGMTAYFSLTEDRDADLFSLKAAWKSLGERLANELAPVPRPIVFTELGYCSQNGANTDPWNYYMNQDDRDLQEQADCFEAFVDAAVSGGLPFLRGAYLFEVYEEGGARDSGYSPRGKPAFEIWRDWASRTFEGTIERVR